MSSVINTYNIRATQPNQTRLKTFETSLKFDILKCQQCHLSLKWTYLAKNMACFIKSSAFLNLRFTTQA